MKDKEKRKQNNVHILIHVFPPWVNSALSVSKKPRYNRDFKQSLSTRTEAFSFPQEESKFPFKKKNKKQKSTFNERARPPPSG